MSSNRRNLLIAFFAVLFPLTSIAQDNISGVVTDETSTAPVEFCSVVILSTNDSTVIDGALTDSVGYFELNVASYPFLLRLSAIGYETQFVDVIESTSEVQKIILSREIKEMDEVVVRGETSEMIFKLDKRIFNVGKDLSNSGGSALEVLNNVPSVEVTLEGEIKLRGNEGVQILINGKPSVVAANSGSGLGSITADMIDRIEIITNPSAKYDASGTTGIINIILKKDSKKGLNGAVTLNTGYPNNHSLGVSLNYRSGKVNIFGQFGFGYRTFVSNRFGHNNDLIQLNELSWTGNDEKNEMFANARIGADFYLNKQNTVTIAGDFAYELETEFATWNYELNELQNSTISQFSRNESTSAVNPKWQFDMSHELQFKSHKDRKLNTSFVGSYFGKEKESEFLNEAPSGTMTTPNQHTDSRFSFSNYSIRTDYMHPFNKGMNMELGLKVESDQNANKMDVFQDESGVWELDTAYTNDFDFSINIMGAYVTFSKEWSKLGVKGGVRYEHTLANIRNQSQEEQSWNYFNFFPSLHVSYKIVDNTSIQLGYSRRIDRPRSWDLNPFISFRDNYNLSVGNPLLQPEFSHVFELTSIHIWEKNSLNLSAYYRYTNDVIEDIYRIENNVSISTLDNIGVSSLVGLELNHKLRMAKWISILTDGNISYFQRSGQYEDQNFDFENYVGSIRTTVKLKFKKGFEAQFSGRYRSPQQNVFFREGQVYYCDLGLRQKILKERGVINLSVRDIFNSRARISSSDQLNFNYYSNSKRGRYIVLGFSYGFGKGETMEYAGQKRF